MTSVVQKYDPDEASYARSASGATGTWAVKAGHAMMLKGGVIMGALARSLSPRCRSACARAAFVFVRARAAASAPSPALHFLSLAPFTRARFFSYKFCVQT
jgi:hypothetical protein